MSSTPNPESTASVPAPTNSGRYVPNEGPESIIAAVDRAMTTLDKDVIAQVTPKVQPNTHLKRQQLDFLDALIRGYGSSERLGRWIWMVDLDAIRQGIDEPPELSYDQMTELNVYWLSMMAGGLSEQSANHVSQISQQFYADLAHLCSDGETRVSIDALRALFNDPIMTIYVERTVRERNAAINATLMDAERIALHARCPTFATGLSAGRREKV